MGRTDENEEPPAGSPESEEMLPLYHESTPFNAAEELKAPDPKATPDEVRDYLVQAMQRRGVGIDHARRIAACWTIGNGQELRAYPVQMYRDIFGAGDAWVVYKAVKGQIYKEENEKDPNYRLGMLCFSLALLALAAGGAAIGVFVASVVLETIGWVVALFGGIFGVVAFFASFEDRNPDKKAESELKAGWVMSPASSGNS